MIVLIPVSGGKDSYFQVHYIKNILGFKPLLLTYYGKQLHKRRFSQFKKHERSFLMSTILYIIQI